MWVLENFKLPMWFILCIYWIWLIENTDRLSEDYAKLPSISIVRVYCQEEGTQKSLLGENWFVLCNKEWKNWLNSKYYIILLLNVQLLLNSFIFIYCIIIIFDMGFSLHCWGWPWTLDPLASASQMRGLNTCNITVRKQVCWSCDVYYGEMWKVEYISIGVSNKLRAWVWHSPKPQKGASTVMLNKLQAWVGTASAAEVGKMQYSHFS
jgi:hypothetical protein